MNESEVRITNITSLRFQRCISTFEKMSGLNVCILYENREEDLASIKNTFFLRKIGHRNNYCNLIKSSDIIRGCQGYDQTTRIGQVKDSNGPLIDECPCGVTEIIIPLRVNNHFLGALFCGPATTSKQPGETFDRVWKMVEPRKLDRDKLFQEFTKFKYYSTEELFDLGFLFYHAIANLSESIDANTTERLVEIEKTPIIKEAILLIQKDLGRIPNEYIIAEEMGVTKEYFSKLFKRVMKINFKDYVIDIRITRSQNLLEFTNLPITEIAFEVGYQSHSYFTKVFHERTKLSPREYRKSTNSRTEMDISLFV
jgi:AraC-like DNA-binding protein/ligand-binding sensor protein